MKELSVYKLHFTTPLHISNNKKEYGVSLKTIASDTMYAALTSCLGKMGMSIPSSGDLGFSISSLFPYYQKEKERPIYFFPYPLQANIGNLDAKKSKKLKKIKWVDAFYFSEILCGRNVLKDEHIKGDYLCKAEDFDNDFISSQAFQRIRLQDRTMQGNAEPYYVDRVFFKDCSGLYFIVNGDTTLLDKALPLLSLEGIGTDRNVGNGFFTFEKDTISLEIPQRADYCLNLSVFFPENKQQLENLMSSESIAYEVERRGGWITTPPYQTIRKNYIYGFSAGSVFRKETKDLEDIGKIVDLRPKWNDKELHSIFRSGRALVLPINI
ncbi:MAG: type III-A CRISPR-associated RAMP protein Csm4 [Bacteroidales bacterium]|nr:type III-A CRISPR-associated RAMP protein Csm4 [Bacteroidales bacterium]